MKTRLIGLFACSVLTVHAWPALAQDTPKRRTIWVPPPAGSLIGGGYVDAGDVPNRSDSIAQHRRGENSVLAAAMSLLDRQTGTIVEGYSLVSSAVAWQTKVPVAKIKRQQKTTGLPFSDLLVANSLAEGSGKNFAEILAMHSKAGVWTPLIKQLRVSMDSIIARTKTAESSVRFAEARNNRRREENKRDNLPINKHVGPPPGQGGG